MTRRLAVSTVLAGAVLAMAGPALAAPPVGPLPDPTDCHSMNKFLHIDNVTNCDGPPGS